VQQVRLLRALDVVPRRDPHALLVAQVEPHPRRLLADAPPVLVVRHQHARAVSSACRPRRQLRRHCAELQPLEQHGEDLVALAEQPQRHQPVLRRLL